MTPTPRLQASALVGLLLATACTTIAPRRARVIEIDSPSFAGIQYPAPAALRSVPQPPPSPPEDVRLASNLPVARPLAVTGRDWANAAVRDAETQDLARGYLFVAQQVNQAMRQSAMGPGSGLELLPVRKVHADLLGELGALVETASGLEGAWIELAQEWGVPLIGPTAGSSRDARLRQVFQLAACVRRDTSRRASDGLAYLDARRQGVDDQTLIRTTLDTDGRVLPEAEEAILHTRDLVSCARQAWAVVQRQ